MYLSHMELSTVLYLRIGQFFPLPVIFIVFYCLICFPYNGLEMYVFLCNLTKCMSYGDTFMTGLENGLERKTTLHCGMVLNERK